MKSVAVEQGLSNVRDYLQSKGCQCVEMNPGRQTSDYSVLVVSGGDVNVMGMHDVQQNVPVVNAEGLTPEQVYQRIQQFVQ